MHQPLNTLAAITILAVAQLSTAQAQSNKTRQLADVGTALSMAWAHKGTLHNNINDVPDQVTRLNGVRLDIPELQSARLNFIGVGVLYQTGFRMWATKITVADVESAGEAFMAGFTGDEAAQGKVILKALVRGTKRAIERKAADEILGQAVKAHGELWRSDLLPVVKRLAGPAAVDQPFSLRIIRSDEKLKSGLVFRNASRQALENVTLMVDSQVGSATSGDTTHFVFLSEWPANQEVFLPWRLTAGVTVPGSNPRMGDTVTFSMWSNEMSLTGQKFKLPGSLTVTTKKKRVRNVERWAPFRLRLVQDGGPTGGN